MTDLLVRNVSDGALRRLERRAEAHGRSVEDELRAILDEVPEPPAPKRPTMTTQEWLDNLTSLDWPADLDIDDIRDRGDRGRSAYISPEGLDRLAGLLGHR